MVWAPSPPPDIALLPIYSPRRENPKGPNSFPEKSFAMPPPSKTNFGGQKSLFRHPAGTGKCPRSHLHYKHETFYYFPTPNNLFETTLKDEKQQRPEV
jgi:hypothetical protein